MPTWWHVQCCCCAATTHPWQAPQPHQLQGAEPSCDGMQSTRAPHTLTRRVHVARRLPAHVWQQLPHEGLVHECVVGAHADAEAGHVADGPQQAACDAAGEHAVHLARVARRAAVLLPALEVKHLGGGSEWEQQEQQAGSARGGVAVPGCGERV